jgi:hypothetical protein
MIIHPRIDITPNRPIVIFREPREQVDLDKALPRILRTQGWACGTFFHIQFQSHKQDKLYSFATYVVTQDDEMLVVNEDNPYQTVTKTAFNYKAEIVGDWWFAEYQEEIDETATTVKMAYDKTSKLHQAKRGNDILYENQFKGKVSEWIRENRPA